MVARCPFWDTLVGYPVCLFFLKNVTSDFILFPIFVFVLFSSSLFRPQKLPGARADAMLTFAGDEDDHASEDEEISTAAAEEEQKAAAAATFAAQAAVVGQGNKNGRSGGGGSKNGGASSRNGAGKGK